MTELTTHRWKFTITHPFGVFDWSRERSYVKYAIYRRLVDSYGINTYKGYVEFWRNVQVIHVENVLYFGGDNMCLSLATQPTDYYVRKLTDGYGSKPIVYNSVAPKLDSVLLKTQPNVAWLWGVPKSGKTMLARTFDPSCYMMPAGNNLKNYDGNYTVVLDDFSDNWMTIQELYLLLSGHMDTRIQMVIITSRFSPLEYYAYEANYKEDITWLLKVVTLVWEFKEQFDNKSNNVPAFPTDMTGEEFLVNNMKINTSVKRILHNPLVTSIEKRPKLIE